jgi:hypothetical protein
MRLVYSVICEMASMREDGRVDIQGIFNELWATGFPAQQDRLVLVAVIEWNSAEKGAIPLTVLLRGPKRESLFRIEAETQVDTNRSSAVPPQTRLILPLEKVVFPQQGHYQFVLKALKQKEQLAGVHLIQQPSDSSA